MIGAQFDGPVDLINYHSQDATTNQAVLGQIWKQNGKHNSKHNSTQA